MTSLRVMQTRLFASLVVTVACSLTACWDDGGAGGGPPADQCAGVTAYEIDTGASLSYTPGVDAGYYLSYPGSGAWHFEWTCDTKLSADGCNFTGSVLVPTLTSGPSCYMCEADDMVSSQPAAGGQTEIDFNTETSTGIDGIDFATTPGVSININLQINGLYQNDLIYLPSGGTSANAVCNPVDLTPSTP
jgi:hypothetical protein